MPHTNLFFPFPVSMCYLFARPLVSFRTLLLHPFCLNGANTVRRFSSAKFTQVGIKNGSDVHFTQKHEWIKVDPMSKIGIVGITEYAEQKLGDIVFVELPEKNNEVHAHGRFLMSSARPLRTMRNYRICQGGEWNIFSSLRSSCWGKSCIGRQHSHHKQIPNGWRYA